MRMKLLNAGLTFLYTKGGDEVRHNSAPGVTIPNYIHCYIPDRSNYGTATAFVMFYNATIRSHEAGPPEKSRTFSWFTNTNGHCLI